MKRYDYLIVGSGLFGAVFAHEAKEHGKRCLVLERRSYKGAIYTARIGMESIYTPMVDIYFTHPIKKSGTMPVSL